MIISLIVAASENNVIGKDNKLLWHLPNDLKFFKNTTWGMPVIMGRKTYDSIAGEPLPGRFNIVITRNTDWNPGREDVWIVQSLEEAVEKAKETDCKEVFVAGGGEIYRQSMPIANRIYLTRVHTIIDGDILFPVIDEKEWEQTYHLDFPADAKHVYAYSFQTWRRISKK
ncbi:MAG: dihydrofolate reductase [Sphingobacteriales bacterium]